MKKSLRRSVLLCLLLVCMMIPVMAQRAAAVESYGLWIGETEVTDEVTEGTGWRYDPGSNTLTLTDELTVSGFYTGIGEDIVIYYNGSELTVTTEGTVTFPKSASYGIYVSSMNGRLILDNAQLDIAADKTGIHVEGKLTVTGSESNVTSTGIATDGIFARNGIRIEGGSVRAEGHEFGLDGLMGVVIEGGKVYAKGPASSGGGINTNMDIDISGEDTEVEAVGGYAGLWAISSVNIRNGMVIASGDQYGSSASGTSISGGRVTLSGKTTASFSNIGIDGYKDPDPQVTVSENADGTGAEPWDETTALGGYSSYKYVKIVPMTEYPLWVGGVQVSSKNRNDILGDGGKAKFDPETNTLTLNNAKIAGTAVTEHFFESSSTYADAIIYADGFDLTIEGKADLEDSSATYGIHMNEGNLTIPDSELSVKAYVAIDTNRGNLISENSNLTLEGESRGVNLGGYAGKDGIPGGEMFIYGGKVTVKGSYNAIDPYSFTAENAVVDCKAVGRGIEAAYVTIKNSTVNSESFFNCIYGSETITIEDSIINVTATNEDNETINTLIRDITITGKDTVVTSKGRIDAYKGNLTISGATVKANGTSSGIRAAKNITITDGAKVTAEATGEEGKAIYVKEGNITITDAKVTATATGKDGSAIYAEAGSINIHGESTVVTADGDSSSIFAEGGTIVIADKLTILEPNDGKLDSEEKNICNSDGTAATHAVIAKGEYYPL